MLNHNVYCICGTYIELIDRMLCRRGDKEFYTNCHKNLNVCYFEAQEGPCRTEREPKEDA